MQNYHIPSRNRLVIVTWVFFNEYHLSLWGPSSNVSEQSRSRGGQGRGGVLGKQESTEPSKGDSCHSTPANCWQMWGPNKVKFLISQELETLVSSFMFWENPLILKCCQLIKKIEKLQRSNKVPLAAEYGH